MTDVIALDGVGKRYWKHEDEPLLVTRALRLRSRTRRSHLWALRDVDLSIGDGACVGVIGRNGSGKSTMLRLLAGVTAPTEGCVAVRGRVAPLLAVGVGFHPELTGRENVLVNGTILGLSRPQIEQRLDAIVAFAGIEPFIDTPVKFYSSGMFVRLGFAVAVASEPDVLLVDEVLAVGDVAFQMQCYERIVELRDAGTTIVVVSHNLQAIRNTCERVVVLHDGRVRHDGDTSEGISRYHDLLWQGDEAEHGGRRVEVRNLELLDASSTRTAHVTAHDEVTLRYTARFRADTVDPIFGLSITNEAGHNVYSDSSPWRGGGTFSAGDEATVAVRLPMALPTGTYTVHVGVATGGGGLMGEGQRLSFFVTGRGRVTGTADLRAELDVVRSRPGEPSAGSGGERGVGIADSGPDERVTPFP